MSATLSTKLQRLDDFLVSEAVGDDAMLLSELDGFLAGLIVCPDMITPSEWLPVVWGEESPVFETERQAQAVIKLIMGHYNDIARQLDQDRYSPIYDIFDDDDKMAWELWVDGFWQAVLLHPEGWLDIDTTDDEDVQTAMFSLSRLHEIAATPPGDLKPMEMDEQLEELAPGLIPYAVSILHRARCLQTAQATTSARQKHPKVGRNDPCPCGSGKKFKRCCLRK
jgi:uncharacterized protein